MKYIIIFTIAIIGCKSKSSPMVKEFDDSVYLYPKFVYNNCTGLWAIETGVLYIFGKQKKQYYGKTVDDFIFSRNYYEMRRNNGALFASLGDEFTFPSKDSAKHFYDINEGAYKVKLALEKRKADSAKRSNDSIFKCQHTYF